MSRARQICTIFFVLLLVPTLAFAVQDSTVVDHTGIFGPVLDRFWPMIVTFLTSISLKVITLFNSKVANWPEPAKWATLYFLALIWNLFAHFVDLGTVDPNAPLFAMSFVEMSVAGLIYKFGGHKVPVTPTAPSPGFTSH